MIEVFLEASAGSRVKGRYDESTLERVGERVANRPYPLAYGFVLGTRTADGEAVDCYVVGAPSHAEGTKVGCEPFGLLEMFEDGEEDHKVLASVPGFAPLAAEPLRRILAEFIHGIFEAYPGTDVRVGRLLAKEAAMEYLSRNAFRGDSPS